MVKALIYLDRQDMEQSAELLEVINRMYGDESIEVHAAVFGRSTEGQGFNFNKIHEYEVLDDRIYNVRWKAGLLEALHQEELFSCMIIPATPEGRLLAPVLSMKLDSGLVADVTDVRVENGMVHMIRPAFDGKLMAEIINQESPLVMMSVRPGVFHYAGYTRREPVRICHPVEVIAESDIRMLEYQTNETSDDIRDAEVLISGGGGVMDDFTFLYRLAKPLKAMVSSSRRLVDSGISERSIQVGQSGKIVSPKLYMALGIYGSLQHIEGLCNVEYIISVNLNKNAPICSLSNIVVEGDAIEFIEQLSKKMEEKQMEE